MKTNEYRPWEWEYMVLLLSGRCHLEPGAALELAANVASVYGTVQPAKLYPLLSIRQAKDAGEDYRRPTLSPLEED